MFLLGAFSTLEPDLTVDTTQVDITEDQTSPDQLREAFQGAANNKVCLEEHSAPSVPFGKVTDSDVLRTHSRM